ncbi:MAG: 4-hydroxy-3-methylbut-2-enyl diphosphate reductase [Turicibacter sp.]|nr:4-hydroxy-3-methylbut-2-enyl diphosphate reductase [Turicibacter sp.]
MNVIKITPRGYCHGVIDALNMAQEAAMDPSVPRPIHILGMIVHNEHITKALVDLGVITVDDKSKTRMELLDTIKEGTVIFTAHGISPAVKEKAQAMGLNCIDASCRDVLTTHRLIEDYASQGYEILYIGKKGHPETEGALGVAPGTVHLIQDLAGLEALKVGTDKLMITNQTTMSLWDVAKLARSIQEKYPTAAFIKEICNATQIRQEAVATKAKPAQLTLVVGDPYSNNSGRLAQVSEELADVPAKRIASLDELDLKWLDSIDTVAVTSGASTPTAITKEVISFLEQYDKKAPETWDTTSKVRPDQILFKRKH